jgi:hypothetical protein
MSRRSPTRAIVALVLAGLLLFAPAGHAAAAASTAPAAAAASRPADSCAEVMAAARRARVFLESLAPHIDPVRLRQENRMKGKKFFVEYLNGWWDLYQIGSREERAAIRELLEPIVERSRSEEYHDLARSDDREFKQDIISYLSACVLQSQFGFDTADYRKHIQEIIPRAVSPEHLRTRGIDNTMALFYRLRQLGHEGGPNFCELWQRPGAVTREHPDLAALDQRQFWNWFRVYRMTHEIFYLTQFGHVPMQCVSDGDLEYIRGMHSALIPIFMGHSNVDAVAELIIDLNYLDMTDLPEYAIGRRFLFDSQNEDGSWGDHDHIARHVALHFRSNPDYLPKVGQYLHTTSVTLSALCHPCRPNSAIQPD